MATKAQEFRKAVQLAAHAKRPAGKIAARQGRRKDRKLNQASHNERPTHTKNSSYELEVTSAPRPSRKSTRKSLNRQKTDSALRITETVRTTSSAARATRR